MKVSLAAAVAMVVMLMAGCGGGSGGGTSPTPTQKGPVVSSTSPTSDATGVAVVTQVSATFSTAMSATTLDASTFTVSAAGGKALTGKVSYNSSTNTATFTPSANLTSNTTYTATLSSTIQSTEGDALASYSWSFTTASAGPAGTATVNFGNQGQVIRGFGGSEAWSGPMPQSQISTLYGTGSADLGLTIMRLRIAPATWDSTAKTADTSVWTTELDNGLAAQQMGAIVFASPWTPPASMKSNNSLNEGSLNTSSYSDYADYLEDYVSYANSLGVNLYAISMQNEPDWNPCGTGGPTASSCYESCLWTGQQMDTWVANDSSVLTTRLIMPESFYFASSMSDPSLNDPNAVNKISIIGGHLYGGNPYYYTLAESLNKDVWMTEHTITLASGETTTQSMDDALAEAKEIHDSMTVGQYNAYVYWWMVNSSSLSYYNGLIDGSGGMTDIGAALAQFSRFIRPGYHRYDATTSPVSGVYVSAYGGNGHEVIVAINTNIADNPVTFAIQNQSVSSVTPYQTMAGAMVAQQAAISVSGNKFTYTLPAQSVTTFVQ